MTFEDTIEMVSPLIGRFFDDTNDDEEIYSKDWREVCNACIGVSRLVGAFPKEYDKVCAFQFRELSSYTPNYTDTYPNKVGHKGDVIVEVSYAPHQHWEFYNMSNAEDVKKIKKDLALV